MTRLDWNAIGSRFYEIGVDRGVLYVGADPGVAWTGLVSVAETPSGGEPKPYYLDGEKYLNLASSEEFEATITALGAPSQFDICDGRRSIQNGLIATHQPRVPFGFSYRTKIGNDIQGTEHGYKIHLVYNALAGPASRSHTSLGPEANPQTLDWSITTLAPAITGYKPTAHLVVDTRYTDPDVLSAVEDVLYGNDAVNASLPSPNDLIAIFTS
jgi:hypothetical protein